MNRRDFFRSCAAASGFAFLQSSAYCGSGVFALASPASDKTVVKRPNILFALADDWSWPHASIAGNKVIKTPTFDRIAREGVLFTNAFSSALLQAKEKTKWEHWGNPSSSSPPQE